MTFEKWLEESGWTFGDNAVHAAEDAWEAAFDEGVKWTLKQDANTLNKLMLTLEEQ